MGFGNEVASVLDVMRHEKRVYKDYLPEEAIKAGHKLVAATKGLWSDVLDTVMELVDDEMPEESPYATVWWSSVLLEIKKEPERFLRFLKYVRVHQDVFSLNTKYFLFYQFKSQRFRFPVLDSLELKEELWMFFREIVEAFAQELETSLEWIPVDKRNKGTVLVITEQFIAIQHGPTKTALDRCKALINQLGKKVLLINTVETMSNVGKIPFMESVMGSYIQELKNVNVQEWKGVTVSYYQCSAQMPNIDEMNQLLASIREIAPEYVITIGGTSILGNLLSRMLPVLTVGLGPSDIAFTTAQYQTLSRKLTDEDINLLRRLGYSENSIIESIFTSSLKPQTEHITRKDIGLPENKFVLTVVGARLDSEVTDEFLIMLDKIMADDMHIAFIGNFSKYTECINKFPWLKEKSTNVGFCSDILSRLEVCDLYVNPIRTGGGTSCVESLYKGIPVVSVAYGDVYINVGNDFCVKDYNEMQEKIQQYYEDKEYYAHMSQKAQERAAVLLDTETEFVRILNEFCERKLANGEE